MPNYEEGQRVALVCTNDPYTKLQPGDRGTVSFTDSAGTVHIAWDSGSNLGIVPESGDAIELVTDEDEPAEAASD